jgi:hypothetical protein
LIEDEYLKIPKNDVAGLRWIDPLKEEVRFYGLPWIKENQNYERLPLSKKEEIEKESPKCYALGRHSSGAQLHFLTNSTKLVLRAVVHNSSQLSGMTTVAQAGFDCYVGSNYSDLKFYDTTRYNPTQSTYEYTLFKKFSKEEKLVVINFPLYNKVEALYLAIDEDSTCHSPEDLSKNGKWMIYGTSITQGGCCSRPGLNYVNQLSRRFQCEFINFGFSGNAFGENVFARLMAEVDGVTMYFIDYEANGGTNGKLAETLEDFILSIRKKHPLTPIVVISRIKYLFDELYPTTLGVKREQIRLFQKNLVARMRKNDTHLYYINGQRLITDSYDECTIDSIHPNDIGFWQITNNLEKEIKKIIKKEKEA